MMMMTEELLTFKRLPFLVPPYVLYTDKYRYSVMEYISAPMVDRTETFKDCGYPNIVIEQKIPTTPYDPGSFRDVVNRTALQLIARSKREGRPIAVLYSGGLDSTCVVSAFLAESHPILLVGSAASIQENPEFYAVVLKDNPQVCLEMNNPLLFLRENADKYLFVTGECGAHLMGTINWTKYGGRDLDNIDAIEADQLASSIFKNPEPYFNIPDHIKKHLLVLLEKSPVSLRTNYDAQWWVIFALKWQFVQYRIQMWIGQYCPTLVNFFMTDEFQHWALAHDVREKCPNFEWRNYKMPIRDYIYGFCGLKSASYDLPKRSSMERTYRHLQVAGNFVLDEPRQVGFMLHSSRVRTNQQIEEVI